MKKINLKSLLATVILGSSLIFSGCAQVQFNSGNDNETIEFDLNSADEADNNTKENSDNSDNKDNKNNETNTANIIEESEKTSAEYSEDKDNATENTIKESSEDSDAKTDKQESSDGKQNTTKESGTPVDNHGELTLKGTQIVDKNGKAYQLHGVSTHGIAWFPQYVNKDGFKSLRDEWGVNLIRLAMYSDENNGYCSGGNQKELKDLVNNGVAYATELGMYVIIDWHVLGDKDPNVHKDEAIKFFNEMSQKYADYDNVIYEICNEPNGGTSWSMVKSYAEQVIPVIKKNNPDAIIIVGTPNWSQDVDIAANDPITGYTNIMYAIHFYADTHKDSLRQKMNTALSKNIPIFCSEFGICDASGNGAINVNEANKWIDAMNSSGISYSIWNLSNKNESSSLIKSSCDKTSGWSTNDLSDEGKWYVETLGGKTSETTSGKTSETTSGKTELTSSTNITSSSGKLEASISNTGGWNDGKNDFTQYTITLSNKGNSSISNWKLTVSFKENIDIDQSWSGDYKKSGNKITATPVDYNVEIGAGQSVEIGFIVKHNGNLSDPVLTIN